MDQATKDRAERLKTEAVAKVNTMKPAGSRSYVSDRLRSLNAIVQAEPLDTSEPPPPEPTPTPPPVSGLSPIAAPVGPLTDRVGGQYGAYLGPYEILNQGKRLVEKLHCRDQTDDNVRIMAWQNGQAQPVAPPVEVHDLVLEDASRATPMSANGTTESNLWIGSTANVSRCELRRGAWMGLWTGGICTVAQGGCYRAKFEDMKITEQRVGIYVEHNTRESEFRRMLIGSKSIGIKVEWWYSGQGSHHLLFEDMRIDCGLQNDGNIPADAAVWVDAGNYAVTFRNIVIPQGRVYLPNRRVVDIANTTTNVRRPDGSAVPIVYHDRAIGA